MQHSVLLRINIAALRRHAEHCGTVLAWPISTCLLDGEEQNLGQRAVGELKHTHTHTSPGWFFKAALQIDRKRSDLFASISVQDLCSDAYRDEWYSHQRTRRVIVMATRLIMGMINEVLSCYTVSILCCCIHHILKQTFAPVGPRINCYIRIWMSVVFPCKMLLCCYVVARVLVVVGFRGVTMQLLVWLSGCC